MCTRIPPPQAQHTKDGSCTPAGALTPVVRGASLLHALRASYFFILLHPTVHVLVRVPKGEFHFQTPDHWAKGENYVGALLKYGLDSVRPALPESRNFQMVLEVPRLYKDTDLSQSVTLSSPSPTEAPRLNTDRRREPEDTESLERLRQQISIRLWAHPHTHNRCAAQKFVVFGHKCCVQFVSKVTMTELEKLGIPRLNDHNYVFWHIKMRAYLVARGYSAAITNAEDANSDKALASITLAVEDHFLPTVYKAASAKAAWDALEALFQQRSVANQLNLTQELNNLTLQPGETITQLLARARIIWEQLKAAGIDKSEQEVALSVLSGLPADFNTLVTVLQNQSGPLTLRGIQKAVLTEQQRANKVGASTSTAASTKAF
eukprot:jgi/Chrzof1/7381/Cz02g21210.t1